MIHIIKHGRKCYKLNCPDCGCIWTFEKEDITKDKCPQFHDDRIYASINCPDCNKKFITWDEEEWLVKQVNPFETIIMN